MDGLPLLCFIATLCVKVISGCDISTCLKNNHFLMPQTCQAYTSMLKCLKKEYDGCTNPAAKAHLTMGIQMAMKSSAFCGYDMNQMTQMMAARTGLMTSLMNGTNGMHHMMMGDGPFDMDDDDGPFDDGPFDDGPFDDGPFDDAGENGMGPFLAPPPGGASSKTVAPPPAPGLLPSFRGGSMMQTNDNNDHDSGSVQNVQSWSRLTIVSLLVICVLNGL